MMNRGSVEKKAPSAAAGQQWAAFFPRGGCCGKSALFPLLLAMVLLSSSIVFAQIRDMKTDLRTNNQLVRYYYSQVEKTPASIIDAREHVKVIRKRLACYLANPVYTERVHICNGPYVKKIVQLARNSLTARPSLGDFVRTVNICPVIYNMCMGKKDDVEECILFERKCIDYVLDEYWRGNWKHTLKELH